MFDTTTSQHIMMVRRLNVNASAYISQPPPPLRVEGQAGAGGGAVRVRDCELMMYESESIETLFSPE